MKSTPEEFKQLSERAQEIGETVHEAVLRLADKLKEPFRQVVGSLLADIGIAGEDEHKFVMDLIPLWQHLDADKRIEIGSSIAAEFDLGKFYVLMDELSKKDEERAEIIDKFNAIPNVNCIVAPKENTK